MADNRHGSEGQNLKCLVWDGSDIELAERDKGDDDWWVLLEHKVSPPLDAAAYSAFAFSESHLNKTPASGHAMKAMRKVEAQILSGVSGQPRYSMGTK